MKTFIYTISDEFGNIRYIGKTNSINRRLKSHINEKRKSHKNNWLKSIINRGSYPTIEILDEVDVDNWEFYETYWISQFKSWGFDLLNLTNGGDGSNGYKHTKTSKEKMRSLKLGRKLSLSHKINISKSIKDISNKNPFYNRGVGNSRIIINKEELYNKYVVQNLSLNKCALYFNVSKKTIFTNVSEYGFNKDKSIWRDQLSTRPKIEVIQYSKNMDLIKEFRSITEASKELNIDTSNISNCCKGKYKSAGGYIWRFKNSDKI